MQPADRLVTRNFVLGTYATQEAIDADDGSSYFHAHHNFFAYGARGLKSYLGGHDNRHENNVYAWVGECFSEVWTGNSTDSFVNNTCISSGDRDGFGSDCPKAVGHSMVIHGNAIYTRTGELSDVKICDKTNHVAGRWPVATEMVKMAKRALGSFS